MIVTCTSCKTRFRVSGEKVGPKGARIRCSRCKSIFVVTPGEPGGVPEDPPDPTGRPELEPPPLPATRAAASPAEPSAADAFRPSGSVSRADPFAAAAVGPADSPFAAVLSAPSGTLVDPFALAAPAAPGGSATQGALSAEAGWDPFGVAEPAQAAVHGSNGPPPSRARGRTELTDLLDEPPQKPPMDLASLSLEEGGHRRDETGRLPDAPDLDLRPRTPAPTFAFAGDDPFDVPFASTADAAADPEPPTMEPAPVAATSSSVPPPVADPPAPPAPRPPAAEAAPSGADANTRRGRLAAAAASSFSLVLLVAIAAALFVGWRSGLVASVRGALGRGAPPAAVTPSGVSGGLYDTAAGAPVLVVRGRVDARAPVRGPVRVRVDLLDGARVVASATGLAGAAATAEEVYASGAPPEAAALRRALDARAVPDLAAGASAPFLVLFPAPAPEPRGLRLRVAAEPSPAAAQRL